MKSVQTTRRAFLRGSTGTLGALVLPVPLVCAGEDADDPALREQQAFIRSVLHKQVSRSGTIRRHHVNAFARGFNKTYGLVEYRDIFGGLVGEYRLTRLFVRSLQLS